MQWKPDRVLVYQKSTPSDSKPPRRKADPNLGRGKKPPRVRIGIWDLDASAGSLPLLLDALQEVQTKFSFSSVEAAFQTGLSSPGAHVAREWYNRTGETMSVEAAALNVAAVPLFAAARPVLAKLPLDWLVVVVKSMISDTSDPADSWHNLFSTSSGRIVLISTFEVRRYSAEAGRPFEAAVAGIAMSAILAAMVPEIEYNRKESTGSIFDFNEDRQGIVLSIRNPQIDTKNRKIIPPELLDPTEKILEALVLYNGNVTQAQLRRQFRALTDQKRSTTPDVDETAETKIPLGRASFRATLDALNASLPKTSQRAPRTDSKHAGRKRKA